MRLILVLLLMLILGCTAENPGPTGNPASVHCLEDKGRLVPNEDQTNNCTLPDGTVCEEWAYFRGECPKR